MSSTRSRADARQERLVELSDAQEKLAHWEAQQASAEAELQSMQERAGEEAVDSPGSASALSRTMQELRDQIDIARRAVTAMGPRIKAAESAYLLAEADVYERAVVKARAALDKHNDHTKELLGQLAEHEGPFVPEHRLVEERRANATGVWGEVSKYQVPKSQPLETALSHAQRPVAILRAMAAGEDPRELVAGWSGSGDSLDPADVYPPCVWGPEAIVPAPGYGSRVEHRSQLLADVESRLPGLQAAVEQRQQDLDDAEARGDLKQLQTVPRGVVTPTLANKLQAAQEKLRKAVEQRDSLRTELEALTGERPDTTPLPADPDAGIEASVAS